MGELINSYDSYGDFQREVYFSSCYDILPSSLKLELPLKESRENMELVLDSIDFNLFELKPSFKSWNTKDAKNSDISEDYPYEYLFKSKSRKLLIWISLSHEELFIDFIYDLNDAELEKWILVTNHSLRSKFGELKRPTFKILSRSDREFYTKNVSTGDFETMDVAALYNEDFKEIDTIIVNSIRKATSGLILLHGEPGTGKTSYIKHLIAQFEDTNFIFIQNEFVRELLKPEFISFLLKHRNSVLVIEDAEKVIMSRDNSNEGSVVSTILQLTDGLFSDYLNIKIICTFNASMEKIDKALLRKGRMIANYKFEPLTVEKSTKLLNSLGFESLNKEMTLADIFKFKQRGFQDLEPKKIGFR